MDTSPGQAWAYIREGGGVNWETHLPRISGRPTDPEMAYPHRGGGGGSSPPTHPPPEKIFHHHSIDKGKKNFRRQAVPVLARDERYQKNICH